MPDRLLEMEWLDALEQDIESPRPPGAFMLTYREAHSLVASLRAAWASDAEHLKEIARLREALRQPTHEANDYNCQDWPPGAGCDGCRGDEARAAALTPDPGWLKRHDAEVIERIVNAAMEECDRNHRADTIKHNISLLRGKS